MPIKVVVNKMGLRETPEGIGAHKGQMMIGTTADIYRYGHRHRLRLRGR